MARRQDPRGARGGSGAPGGPAPMSAAFEHHPDAMTIGVAVRDDDGAIADVRVEQLNAAARARVDPEAAVGRTISELWPQMVVNGALAVCLRVLETGTAESGEFWWAEAESTRPAGYEYRATRLEGDRLLWVLRDNTALVGRLERHMARFRAVFHAAPVGMALVSLEGDILETNEALTTMLERDADRLVGLPLPALVEPSDASLVSDAIVGMVAGASASHDGEFLLRTSGGHQVWARLALAPVRELDGSPSCLIAHLVDVTEQKSLESALSIQALRDPLTGLANRVLLRDRVAHAISRLARRPGTVGVLFVDIDQFKVVNDGLGHDIGDALLVAVADRLRHALREGDEVARFGSDEFVVLCEDLRNEAEAVTLASRLQVALRDPIEFDGHRMTITVSTGIATTDSPATETESLLRDADVAMYRAKEQGRNRSVLFSTSLRERAVGRVQTEIALRQAFDAGQFFLHYQPIIDLTDGHVSGVEALLRWRHPQRGLVPPSEFIPVAEETGLIVALGERVLEEACAQARRWQEEANGAGPLTVSVNLSGRQTSQPDLVDVVAGALERARLDPSVLVLEITESVLMTDAETSIEVLQALKGLGVRLSVDDFGTGYSSLSYLKRFPIDLLKIDRSFVDGLGQDPEDSAIVAVIVRLAETLGLLTVAEGAETERQLSSLVELGCQRAQGFYFSPPVPPVRISDLLRSHHAWDTGWPIGR